MGRGFGRLVRRRERGWNPCGVLRRTQIETVAHEPGLAPCG
jgi:hypothetical protein